jgi:hypothetical protein
MSAEIAKPHEPSSCASSRSCLLVHVSSRRPSYELTPPLSTARLALACRQNRIRDAQVTY